MLNHSQDIKKYEIISEQQINFLKLSIQFGDRIEEASRHDLRYILGIQNIGCMRSYIELPESLGEFKIQVFGFVYDRLNNMINDWIFKFFTKRGKKEILK